MAKTTQSFDPRKDPDRQGRGRFSQEDRERYPALTRFLSGEPGSEAQPETPPGSLMVYLNGSTVQACLYFKDTPWQAFIPCTALSSVLSDLDANLALDQVDWQEKAYKGR